MPQNAHLESITAEAERLPRPALEAVADVNAVRSQAAELASGLAWLPDVRSSRFLVERCKALHVALKPVLAALQRPLPTTPVSDDFRWLYDNVRLLYTQLLSITEQFKQLEKIPQVRNRAGAIVPRIAAVAEDLLTVAKYQFSEEVFTSYVEGFQENTVLRMVELWALVPALKLVLLEEIVVRGSRLLAHSQESCEVGVCIRSLRDMDQTPWKELVEPLILFDKVLRQDPAGAYPEMDFESRDLYRDNVANIAKHSDLTETEVALEALALAREAQSETYANPRAGLRHSHIGYYLLGPGTAALRQKAEFRPPFGQRITSFLRKHPDEFYLPSIEVLMFAIMSAIVLLLTDSYTPPRVILGLMLVLLLPCSQSAVQVVNYLITSLLPPQILPKLDFSNGIPDHCLTMVAVPSLLLNEEQVRRLVDDLEVRFLGNHDRNMHFALVTDLPDSREPSREEDPLVDLCSELIQGLNEKYAGRGMGSFFLLHRHRVYNPRERVWMGWERKRGKLLDLNKLLRQEHDSFPVKVGDLSILPRVRFVITLDSDTELPRGSAHRMVGALAHPLNQAIIDPERNIVVAGYGILQPRIGVSVQSAARSRLATIYSGETGLDIYTRAVSDVYQDLYGEGSYTGKGIYEVDVLHRVLHRRFPRNALLSHDLLEGAYARAGLASDIEVIEDYPSHYTAYNRRKHRWLRGDWQIAGWLFPVVSDELGHPAANPISITSQWKILDNLRRSLVEPAIFLLLVVGWLVLPGTARNWTVTTIAILFVPAWLEFTFNLVRAVIKHRVEVARDALDTLVTANVSVFLMLTFLAHQTLLSLDAVVRVLVRRMVTRRRLLEWETSAQAELGTAKRTPVDLYLDWTPALALGLGLLVFVGHRSSLPAALPILLLWASSKLLSLWLNQPRHAPRNEASEKDELFLRHAALHTWRYFAEFSTAEHNWLIPDNVQEKPASIAARISPTNLGFLLNSRQVACECGYLTVPEFAEFTERTLATVSELPRHRGHLLNWYDTRTLMPLAPLFVSSVDSGNLVASLWTLQQGCLKRLRQPLLQHCLAQGLADYFRILVNLGVLSRRRLSALQGEIKTTTWLQHLLELPDALFDDARLMGIKSKHRTDAQWFGEEARARLGNLKQVVRLYAPWLLPEFASLRDDPAVNLKFTVDDLLLSRLPDFIDTLAVRLQFAENHVNGSGDRKLLYQRLQALLPDARSKAVHLMQRLRTIAANAGELANGMDFRFLLNRRRKLLSAGYDVQSQQQHPACYDLLATESRTAVFTAIAKEDIPQESWFLLGRAHSLDHGRPVLLSWTGTMFEYLMPALWMRTYPNTLLERSRIAAVRSHQAYAAGKRIPWGISESAYFKTDEAGNYQYHAFGLSRLALRKPELNALVISPYSTFLALQVDPSGALRNLHRMMHEGWFGAYGFYEAADFDRSRRRSWRHRHELVRCWMAHHQGMTLLSIANFLHADVMLECFHANRRVQATELLLHEKPVAHVRAGHGAYRTAA
jgi:cyclic beta-1,2-glucan synthetase